MKTGFDLKAVVFDLDDTLLRDDRTISCFTVDVLRALSRNGISVIPASGRAQMSMKPFVDQLGCADYYISCNGAEIWDAKTGRNCFRTALPVETARRIVRFGKEYDCYMQTYDAVRFFYNREGRYADAYAASAMLEGECAGDLEVFIRTPVTKILMMDDAPKIAAMLEEGRKRFDGEASVTCSKPVFLEFNPLDATKGLALARLLAALGISPADTAAFGDSLNDWSMLEACGLSVCVSNARPELKGLCEEVCLSNQEDGVADFLNRNFLREMSV
jgi:hypothetical protein